MKKVCTKCKIEKELTVEFFGKYTKAKDNFRGKCKLCRKEYYINNLTEIRKKRKEYQEKNKIRLNEVSSEYYYKNKEAHKVRNRVYKSKNDEKIKEYKKQYDKDNFERISKQKLDWSRNNRGRCNSSEAKREANKLNATPKWSESSKIKVIYEKAKWLESLTGLKYHVDHIVPLQGKNVCGLHVWENLQILESSLNCSKGNTI